MVAALLAGSGAQLAMAGPAAASSPGSASSIASAGTATSTGASAFGTAASAGASASGAAAQASAAALAPTVVPAEPPADLAAVAIPSADDIRGNIHLPATLADGTAVTWSSSDPAVVTDAPTVTPEGEIAPGAVIRGAADTAVQLTATTVPDSGEPQSRVFDVMVKAAVAEPDPDGYMFTYFAGESTDAGEEIYFGASEGSSPLEWDELNGGNPVLTTSFGEEGLRDPMIIRSPEGDKFFIVATDLKIYPSGDFGRAQRTGSLYLEIWESTDLVNWSPQRHVKVSDEATVGNTWAPEAYYDETIGEYVVFWASNLYDPATAPEARDNFATYNRMMYATTRDFVTFSEPQIWSDSRRGRGLGLIDSTVIKDGDTYYRFTKDEGTMNVLLQKSDSLRATSGDPMVVTEDPNEWSLVTREIGRGQSYVAIDGSTRTYTGGEGPTVFKDVDDDGTWWMFIDQPGYHGGVGYVAFRSTDKGLTWQAQDSSGLPGVPRHGTVLPITAEEQERLQEAYNTIESVETTSFEVSTTAGEAPRLPRTVPATYTSGSTGSADITWDEIDPAAYATAGSFTVNGSVEGFGTALTAQVTVTEAPGIDEGLVVHYELDETTGSAVADSSGNSRDATVEGTPQWTGADGFRFTGGTTANGNRIKLPNNLLTGLDEVSVSFDLYVEDALPQNTMAFVLGNQSTANSGYLFATARDYNNTYRAAITASSGGAEQSAAAAQRLPAKEWVRVTYTVAGGDAGRPGVARLYQDERLVATNANITTTPGAIGNGTTTFNYLGRSSWAADPLFNGQMRDFRIYDRALDAASVSELAGEAEVVLEADLAAIDLGDTSAVTSDLTLPTTSASGSSTLSWSSSDESVVSASGRITRPAFGSEPATVTLTVTATIGSTSKTRTFEVTVAPLPAEQREVDRIAGADRYEVAVNTSKAGFADGSSTVYVASGAVFPDALSAAPAATVAGAPILLTTTADLPADVAAEIKRLGATKIVIVGGTATVSANVEASLAKLGTVTRIGGADRYEASRNIAKAAFPSGAPTAVLSAGTKFADALSAGAAIDGDGPVILVKGTASTLDAATKKLLADLDVKSIAIAGGEASVSAGIQTDAAAIATTVRLGGADRYEASRSINDHFFTEADHVLLATGLKFSDALAGSAYGPRIDAPLFTVKADCIPAATLAQIEELGATKVTLLGGPASLSAAVENLVTCK
jgi:putative cell wall-binding protein